MKVQRDVAHDEDQVEGAFGVLIENGIHPFLHPIVIGDAVPLV